MLELRNIDVNYGDKPVLRNVSIELKKGGIIALLGANGAGKTTLVRVVNGTLPIAKGEITIDGKALSSLSRREIAKYIAVVAQENETRFPITVLEFVLAGRFVHGGAFGWESEEDIATAKRALKDCDLAEYETCLMNRLSGGERQRVVLARALATGAKTLLLDEPTANLDLAHQAMMFRLVRELCDKDDASAIVITHDLNLAAAFADEVIMLKKGSVFAKGKPDEVLTAANIAAAFGVKVLLQEHPVSKNAQIVMLY